MTETVGQRLRAARESQKLTLEKAAAATRLRVHHLQALEADDYSVMASVAQGRGFLRLYADYLGIDLEQVIREARHEPTPPAPEPTPPAPPEAAPAPEPVADLAATAEPARTGFWSRLMRRAGSESAPQEPATPATATVKSAPAPRKTRAAKSRAAEETVEVASDKKKRTLNP